ncbi:conserved hypothetical protein [Vibrio crassostreae]|nr:conserved hypothetical protein [Vibrio crassostreae]CAK2335549.1 conserved hypothetical protein [Vibrio crassostreae]CAK2504032.1 conserved hypothetical protein [Vibrio crassostreae]CAK2909165.1 conserved hypothetical protein [Vibrio crassostreae]
MYKFNVNISINNADMFEGVLTTPNKTAIRDQLQFIEDGSRKGDCTPINQFKTNEESQRAIQVLLANCWASLSKKQYKFLTWLSGCPQGMEVFVELEK